MSNGNGRYSEPTHIRVNCGDNTNSNLKVGPGSYGNANKHGNMKGNSYNGSNEHMGEYEKGYGGYGSDAGLWAFIFIIFIFAVVVCCLWCFCPRKLRVSNGDNGCVDFCLLFIAALAITIFILFLFWLLYKLVCASRCEPRHDYC